MVLLLHTSVTCNNLISECDSRQNSSLWYTGGEQDVCLQKSQTFPEVPWAGHLGLHQRKKGQLCTWWVEMDAAAPRGAHTWAMCVLQTRNKMSLFTNKSPQIQLTAVGMCISKSMIFVESKAALPSEAGINQLIYSIKIDGVRHTLYLRSSKV